MNNVSCDALVDFSCDVHDFVPLLIFYDFIIFSFISLNIRIAVIDHCQYADKISPKNTSGGEFYEGFSVTSVQLSKKNAYHSVCLHLNRNAFQNTLNLQIYIDPKIQFICVKWTIFIAYKICVNLLGLLRKSVEIKFSLWLPRLIWILNEFASFLPKRNREREMGFYIKRCSMFWQVAKFGVKINLSLSLNVFEYFELVLWRNYEYCYLIMSCIRPNYRESYLENAFV